MKKILLVLAFCLPAIVFGQTIKDRPDAIEIIKPQDTLIVLKKNILYVDFYYNYIYVVLGQKDGQNKVYGGLELKLSDFSGQFSTLAKMGEWFEKAYTKEYTQTTYHYTGSNMDTASYYIGSSIVYKKVYVYSGSNVTTAKVIYP